MTRERAPRYSCPRRIPRTAVRRPRARARPVRRADRADSVEGPMLDAVRAGSSAAILGARGSEKSSVLAWMCRQLPDDHVAIRVPVVGMDDPSGPAVLRSVALGAALGAARANEVDVSGDQREAIESARADDFTRRPGRTSGGAKLGGGPVPAEISAQLESLEIEYSRGRQPADRLYGLDRLLAVVNYTVASPSSCSRTPKPRWVPASTMPRATASSLAASSCWYARSRRRPSSRFKTTSPNSRLTPTCAPTCSKPRFRRWPGERSTALRAILTHRLEVFGIGIRVENLIVDEALAALASL